MKSFLDIIIVLWDSGLLGAVVWCLIKFIKAHTKNKNILMFNTWAEQAVAYAEVKYKTNDEKKEAATLFIRKRLKANNLVGHFSDYQIDGAIEWALQALKEKKAEVANGNFK